MSDAMTTIGEKMVRRIVAEHGDKYQIIATCGSDFVVHEHHKPECNGSDCMGCSQACIETALATYEPTGAGPLLQSFNHAPSSDIGIDTAVAMRDVLRDIIGAGAGPATSIQYLLQCIEHWVDSKQIDHK